MAGTLAISCTLVPSVLEFSSPTKGAMFCPDWMMENLMVADGDALTLRLRELPKATKVRVCALCRGVAWCGVWVSCATMCRTNARVQFCRSC